MRAFRNVLFIFVLSLFLPANVFAAVNPDTWSDGSKSTKLCEYTKGNKSLPKTRIIYNGKNKAWGLYYKAVKGSWLNRKGKTNSYSNTFYQVDDGTYGSGKILVGWIEGQDEKPTSGKFGYTKDKFRCPPQLCYSANTLYFGETVLCGKTDMTKLSNSYNIIDDIEKNVLSGDSLQEIYDSMNVTDQNRTTRNSLAQLSGDTEKEDGTKIKTLRDYFRDKALIKIQDKYFYGNTVPDFIVTYIQSWAEKNVDEVKENVQKEADEALQNGDMTEQQHETVTNNIQTSDFTNEKEINYDTTYGNTVKDPTTDVNCSSILTKDLTILVKNVINFVRFLGPLLVIVFTIIEFAGAIFSADVSITKPLGRLIRRLIAAALLFFLPFLIFPLFDFLHITMAKECFSILN